jgi:hypothetical protein
VARGDAARGMAIANTARQHSRSDAHRQPRTSPSIPGSSADVEYCPVDVVSKTWVFISQQRLRQ